MGRKFFKAGFAIIFLGLLCIYQANAASTTHTTINKPTTGIILPSVQKENVSIYEKVPSRQLKLPFTQIAAGPGNIVLSGVNPQGHIEFGMRSDEMVSEAKLKLEYTPSPSLLPVLSQLKVYLNDELMEVLPIFKEQLGKKTLTEISLNPLYFSDFNRLRFELISHYQSACENLTSGSLWLDIGRNSELELTFQRLNLKNDLSYFPVPFFDPRDNRTNTLPMVFAGTPDKGLQQASAIVASWFGAQSGWRGHRFPVFYDQLPESNAVVFATNNRRPDFLRDHPLVNAPVIEMINHPQNPFVKLLVLFGRDDNDLLQAAKGLAQGNILFRGDSVVVNDVEPLLPRKPYDAPNWVRTDRPVTFAELKTYEGQLQASALESAAINISFNLPPDLFLLRNRGVDMKINYRYTTPMVSGSRVDVSLNNQYLESFRLNTQSATDRLLLRLPLLQELLDDNNKITVPALTLGALNQLRFNFEYVNTIPRADADSCIISRPLKNHAVIADDSTIDFSKYHHFIAMPDLRAFVSAGFPFSRMADLSETVVVMPEKPGATQVEILLNTLGLIGAQTGFPAINLTITDDISSVRSRDADILLIGTLPQELEDKQQINLLIEATTRWVKSPMRHAKYVQIEADKNDQNSETQSTIVSPSPMAAVVGFQSPYHTQRSVIALMTEGARGDGLLNNALVDSVKRGNIFGSVAVIRESGVDSLRAGDTYYVGDLPWFERIQYVLARHPVLLAVLATLSVVLLAWVAWRLLRIISRRRLNPHQQ
ncbi:cellulose biosynthesis cyclic di-GMP-binding regulatory protein BcsB [Escherichia marmotae]|uniref:cellulose biosynthesis cyclic di-GMP-binding regulatory protein BcsB n=1 Tax=Escherichia marmotae TaxID=1499973 RepID=UPI001E5E0520|nr:cellulose biosynthesis cyclic di-GMP-binding regulatory protein BcsB [Escherichia marmotae]MED0631905.1 cellulose biosynthesis cyclic di-GMP-binding regulatory protein BcsB [Escherichia marmotae]